MADHMSQSLAELCKAIIADGVVDASEVAKLRERLFADGKIDHEEAELLFEINDKVSGQDNDSGWQQLFVDAICDHVLNDDDSPGAVDDREATWLLERVQRDEQVDEVERALLKEIGRRATSMNDNLRSYIASL